MSASTGPNPNELPQFPHTSTPATSSIFKKLSRPLFIGGVGIASFAASYGYLEYQKKKRKYATSASPILDALTPSVSPDLVEQVTRKINANAQAFTVAPGNCHITEFHTNTIASNSPIEDRHNELLHDPQIYDGSLFGLYDGHGGWAASEFVKNELFDFVKLELGILKLKQEKFIDSIVKEKELRDRIVDFLAKDPASPQLYEDLKGIIAKQSQLDEAHREQLLTPLDALFNPERNISQCLQLAFLRADSYFLYEALLDPEKLRDGFSGACVLLSYFLNDHIYVANAGDCRAVLGRKRDSSGDPIKGADTRRVWEAIELSHDHGTENLEERKRLIEAHPNEDDIVLDERVKGSLQPTRGIGDGLFKDPNFNDALARKLENWHPPYTTAMPEVISHKITPADQFVVLATDGLFDFFTSQEVVDMVGHYLEHMQRDPKDDSHNRVQQPPSSELKLKLQENASSYLIGKVLNKAGYGKTPEVRMNFCITLPREAKRGFFDDTTVTVIFLGPHITSGAVQDEHGQEEDTEAATGSGGSEPVLAKPAVMERVEGLIEQKVREDQESGMMWKAWHQSFAGGRSG